ncbi:MAG: UDP-galactopyranose mutase [Pedobacter sp.]|nr:MAG: UDP-galactopyranose mutase [Pedobacter sp.]
MKIGVIGSGISGLSIAQTLKDKHDVTVFEKENLAGGLIKCTRVNDCLFHKVGGHVFNSKNQEVHEWFWSFFDKEKEFVEAKREAKILFREQLLGYPIENYLYLLDKSLIKKIIEELLTISKQPFIEPNDLDNFLTFLNHYFGKTLAELYFIPYNTKIWNTDLSKVPMQWLEGKLPMPNIYEIITKNILKEEESTMVHSSFYYPKEEGSQFIVNRLKENLNIIYNENASELTVLEGKFLLNGEAFDQIIYCADIRKLPKAIQEILVENNIDLSYLTNLKTNGTSNIFCETDQTNTSWLYIPETFTKAHRIIYTGNFSSTNNRGSKRLTCVVEFSGKVPYEQMCEEIKKLPGNLHALSFNYEENSYIIHDHQTSTVIKKVKDVLQKHGVFLLGRFAEWEYYNMDKAIEGALLLSQRIKT